MTNVSREVMRDRVAAISEMASIGWSREQVASATHLSYQQLCGLARKYHIEFKRKNAAGPRISMRDAQAKSRLEVIREFAETGRTRKEAAKHLGIHYGTVANYCEKYQVEFIDGRRLEADRRGYDQGRADDMARLYADGHTLAQIGFRYGITRERVRQILRKQTDLTREDGGSAVRAARRQQDQQRQKSLKCFDKNGCSLEERAAMRLVAQEMRAKGISRGRTPEIAFRSQRGNAAKRGIEWKLSLWQWWQIWVKSGLWERRGRGHGYVMCRKGDVGPYAVDNVFIASGAENSSMGQKKTNGLPIGVRINRRGPGYLAVKTINRKRFKLGPFSTPESAHQAYTSISIGAH